MLVYQRVTEWLGNIWEDLADMADILPQRPGLVNMKTVCELEAMAQPIYSG